MNHQVYAQNVTLNTTIDSVTAGQVFDVSLKIQFDQEYIRVEFPDSSDFPIAIEVREITQFRITDFSDSLTYSVQYFGIADLTIPPLPVSLVSDSDTSFIFTNPITIPFKSILPSEEAALNPIKPLLSIPSFPWALFVIVSIVLAAAIWAYFTFFKKQPETTIVKKVVEVPFVNPLIELESTLSYLKQEYKLSETKDFKYFYSSLSDSVRKYFEDLYNIPALESTTRELLRYLDAFGVDPDMIKSTRVILNRSDMVKFAKFTPTLDSAWSCYEETVDFCDRARLVDASRITRKRIDHESQWQKVEVSEESDQDNQNNEEDT